jgi:hypothetical protein
MSHFAPRDFPHIFNYYNLTIIATQIHLIYTKKKVEWIPHRVADLVFQLRSWKMQLF